MATITLVALTTGHGAVHHLKPNANTNNDSFKPAPLFPTRTGAFRRSITNWRCRSSSSIASMGTMPAAAVVTRREKRNGAGDGNESMGHHLAPDKLEVLAHLEPWAEAHILPLLKPIDSSWQPSDFLPDASSDFFDAACRDLRLRAATVPDAVLVCLVGNMITEEALPTYQSVPNRFEGGVRDLTGADATAWAKWIRGWSAEENRHGDVLSRYLLLSGRVDMRKVDATVHRLIAAGMDAMGSASAAQCPYHGFIYVAFQERATAISHGNTARLLNISGDAALARICGAIAADEKRHEAAYTRIVGKLFELEPDAAVRALGHMMRRRITMPAALMDDGCHGRGELYARYAAAAAQAGVYTASDYREILEHMIGKWGVEDLAAGLSGEGRRARDYVCGLPEKIKRVEEKAHDRAVQVKKKKPTDVPFSWIFDRPVSLMLP